MQQKAKHFKKKNMWTTAWDAGCCGQQITLVLLKRQRGISWT